MKFLLVLAVVVVAIWVWRNNRRDESDTAMRSASKTPALPLAMVACLQCGMHLPESEAVQGVRGRYCCKEHRQLHERTSA